MRVQLGAVYKKLFSYFGSQHWWPAESPFEVMVGSILTQNTSWQNVEKAICNLKQKKLLSPHKLLHLPRKKLAACIKSAGYYNIKAKRLKNFLRFFSKNYQGDIKKMSRSGTEELRRQLLSVSGIGQETADSMLLYALNKPIFVVDAYTKRILQRHGLVREDCGYNEIQDLFMQNIAPDVKLFNEYHALLVKLGKEFCLKRKPKCEPCPLKNQIPNIKKQNHVSKSKNF